MTPMLGIMASSMQGGVGDYESIATYTATSSVSTISFTSIPGTYKHLQIRFLARCSRSDYTVAALYARFNSDTASNYSGHYLVGDGSTSFAYGGANYGFAPAGLASGANSGTNVFSVGVVDILDYQNTNKYKTVRSLSGVNRNATGDEINLQSGNWRNTAAITSIDFTLETNATFSQYSTFALYGVK